jgi:hypothetical protein
MRYSPSGPRGLPQARRKPPGLACKSSKIWLVVSEGKKMEYRGKSYSIVQGIGPDSWKWTVQLDERTVKSGVAKTRVPTR